MSKSIFERALDRAEVKGLPVYQVEVADLETLDGVDGTGLPDGTVVIFRKSGDAAVVRAWNAVTAGWVTTTLGNEPPTLAELGGVGEPEGSGVPFARMDGEWVEVKPQSLVLPIIADNVLNNSVPTVDGSGQCFSEGSNAVIYRGDTVSNLDAATTDFNGAIYASLCPNLATISVAGSFVTSLDTSNLSGLNEIYASGSSLGYVGLQGLTSLTYLDLSSTFVTSLPFIADCVNLSYLSCSSGVITDANEIDAIIIAVAANALLSNIISGTLDLSGGTNAAPTAASADALTDLSGLTWSVFTN